MASTPVTEYAFIPLRPGVDITDQTLPEGKIMAQMLQKGKIALGVQANYWGVEEHNAQAVHLLLDWDSLAAHENYIAQPGYAEFLATAQSMVDPQQEAMVFHIPFSPHPPSAALLSPVCEVLRLYVPETATDAQQQRVVAAFRKFVDDLQSASTKGFTGSLSSGWGLETVVKNGEKRRVFVAVLGWESERDAEMCLHDGISNALVEQAALHDSVFDDTCNHQSDKVPCDSKS